MATAPLSPGSLSPTPTSEADSADNTSRAPDETGGVSETSALSTGKAALTIVMLAAGIVSIIALIYFYSNSMTNVYGDGVAHLNIARKVVDSPDQSIWQRYMQIGSPWLPLQTILMLPLVWNDWLWRTGLAGSIVSMACFVITAGAVYQIARSIYGPRTLYRRYSWLPFLAAGVFVFNPSAIYIQSTPMTEMVFMAALSLAVLAFQRWRFHQTTRRLLLAAGAMSVATLSRYEAWPVAVCAVLLVFAMAEGRLLKKLSRAAAFSSLAFSGCIYWLWHNWAIYSNALEFFEGPNSARGIYLKNSANLGWSKIFVGHFALDVLLMAVTVAVCVGPFLLPGALIGLLTISIKWRRLTPALAPAVLLAIPVGFEVFSLYRGEIQIFPLSAFGLLNVRYGLSSLLLVSIALPGVVLLFRQSSGLVPIVSVSLLVLAQYGLLLSDGPSELAIYQEGLRNGINAQPARELARAAGYLTENPPRPMILMQTGSLGPLVMKSGLRFSEVIHEGTARWHQIGDQVPEDISTIVVQKGDVLDVRFTANKKLAADVSSNFDEEYQDGSIRVLKRRGSPPWPDPDGRAAQIRPDRNHVVGMLSRPSIPDRVLTRFLPEAFARYIARSAISISSSRAIAIAGHVATPTLAVIWPTLGTGVPAMASRNRSAAPIASSRPQCGSITANSSPPYRAQISPFLIVAFIAAAT